jgi:hypothetical protein
VLDVESGFVPLPLVASHRLQSHALPARIAELAAEQARAFVVALGPELEGTAAAHPTTAATPTRKPRTKAARPARKP